MEVRTEDAAAMKNNEIIKAETRRRRYINPVDSIQGGVVGFSRGARVRFCARCDVDVLSQQQLTTYRVFYDSRGFIIRFFF